MSELTARHPHHASPDRAAGLDAALARLRGSGPALAGWLLPFALVFYLALKGGGYDTVLRGEVGIAVWWVVLLGAAVAVLPASRLSRTSWGLVALLGAFAAWTALGITWSESAERSTAELARVATYLGVFVLALAAQGHDGLRRTVGAVGLAIGLVGLLAVLSRLQPELFPESPIPAALPAGEARLAYPLNYWNGLGAFLAMGLPLIVGLTRASRHLSLQALGAAAVPVLMLGLAYTLSRGAVIEAAAGIGVLFALSSRRGGLLATLAIGGGGGALLVASAAQRDALGDGGTTGAALAQGDAMLGVMVVVCAGVALLQVGVGLIERYETRPAITRPATARRAGILASVAAAVLAVAVLAPGLDDRWSEFKDPAVPAATAERFDSSTGSGRYQWWQAALDANASEPLTGIGPGTYEFWWARDGTLPGFVRDAHSLYLENLAELGIVGFLLICGLVAACLVAGVKRTRSAPAADRPLLAAATAACVVFAIAAGIEWVWELAVLPVAFLLLVAAISQAGKGEGGREPKPSVRAGLVSVAVLALLAIALPLASVASVRSSQDQVQQAELGSALEEARSAERLAPYAATPALQKALVLELAGDLDRAATAAAAATRDEPTNWRTWLVLSRLEAQRGNADASIDAYRRAKALNPRSRLFQ